MKLKTVQEHNAEVMNKLDEDCNTGIECPSCGAELIYSNPNQLLLTYPLQKNVECLVCGYKTTVYAQEQSRL